MRHTSATHAYFIRLGLELDGELIEERFVEPGEVVFIGHEQRTNLLCWGRLPRRMKLFSFERGQPIVMIAPQWLTQHSSPRSLSPRAHPSSRSIPTPLPPGACFTLDLDGALLHIEHCALTTHAVAPEVPDFEPRTGSRAARHIALTSLALCSALWALATLAWASADPAIKANYAARHTSAVAATSSRSPSSPMSPAAQPARASSTHHVGTSMPALRVQPDGALSWQEREVQRLLRRGSEDYRACFDAHMPTTRIIFDLEITPSALQSHIGSLHVSESSGASEQILSCLTSHLHSAQLPHYQDAFAVQFHVIFDPQD